MLRRAFLLAALALPLVPPAAAQQARVMRVEGTVTAENYRALAAFLEERFDQVVALSLTFPANGAYAEGALMAEKEGDLFVSYLAGADGDWQISASTGFLEQGEGFVFDRFYTVKYGGMAQGIIAIYIEPTLPPPGIPVETVRIDSLKAPE